MRSGDGGEVRLGVVAVAADRGHGDDPAVGERGEEAGPAGPSTDFGMS